MLWTIPGFNYEEYRRENFPEEYPQTDGRNDIKVLLVGERPLGMQEILPWRFNSPEYFAFNVQWDELEEVGHLPAWKEVLSRKFKRGGKIKPSKYISTMKVGLYNRSLEKFEGDPQGRYNGHTFDAVAICYDPCSSRKRFELVWTKVCPGCFSSVIVLK